MLVCPDGPERGQHAVRGDVRQGGVPDRRGVGRQRVAPLLPVLGVPELAQVLVQPFFGEGPEGLGRSAGRFGAQALGFFLAVLDRVDALPHQPPGRVRRIACVGQCDLAAPPCRTKAHFTALSRQGRREAQQPPLAAIVRDVQQQPAAVDVVSGFGGGLDLTGGKPVGGSGACLWGVGWHGGCPWIGVHGYPPAGCHGCPGRGALCVRCPSGRGSRGQGRRARPLHGRPFRSKAPRLRSA